MFTQIYVTSYNKSPVINDSHNGPTLFTCRLEVSEIQPDLTGLLEHVMKAAPNWHQLGVHLGVDSAKLATIDQDCNKTVDKFRQMFETWLAVETDPTWYKVADALDKSEQKTLAVQIRKLFCQ